MRASITSLTSVLFAAIACGPTVHVFPLAVPPQPSEASAPIRFYLRGGPQCAVYEVALVRAEHPNGELWSESTARAIRQRARDVGGDAVVGLHEVVLSDGTLVTRTRRREQQSDSSATGRVVRSIGSDTVAATTPTQRFLEGTVVRFADRRCQV